jgi:hypothetical protein
MNATYTLHYGYAELEALAARANALNAAAKTVALIVGAPLLGLVFVTALPLAGLATIGWMAVKALVRNAAVVKRIALFAAAPVIGLAYALAFPFVAVGALAYCAARAMK